MSAANASATPPTLEDEMRAHEPSMEEILASIRRIIADDDSLPGVRRRVREGDETPASEAAVESVQSVYPAPALEPVVARPPAVEPPMGEIHHLRLPERDDAQLAATPDDEPTPQESAVEMDEAVVVYADAYDDQAAEPDADAYADAYAPIEAPPPSADDYAAHDYAASPLMSSDTAASIASHFQALATSMVMNDSSLLQRYAQEMLRPMLKQWLDDNLPVIVERLVRAEIERVARGGNR